MTGDSTLAHLVCLGGLVALAALLRFSGLAAQSFWSDEAITVQLVHMDPFHMLRGVANGESTPRTGVPVASPVAGFRLAGRRSDGFFEIATFKASRLTTVQPVQLAGRTDIDGPMVLLAPR